MSNSQTPPFDLDGLNQMYGKETVLELLEMSVNEVRGLIDEISTGIQDSDSRSLVAAAHQLKGLAATMTFNEMARLSLELETAARQEDWPSIPKTAKTLSSEFDDLATYIASILGS